MITEADTCRLYVLPKLDEAGWNEEPHSFSEQKSFTDGRIVVAGNRVSRRPQKRADYLLRFTRDFMIAVVEAKAAYKTPAAGLQQAKDYAEILGLKFAYATNGKGIVEFDYTTGLETELDRFPTPQELWSRWLAHEGVTDAVIEKLLTPFNDLTGKEPRYYQEIAINRAVQAILQGKPRVLLTMATGTGKTLVAFQICWKLWSSRWNRRGEHRRPKILFLADRTRHSAIRHSRRAGSRADFQARERDRNRQVFWRGAGIARRRNGIANVVVCRLNLREKTK